LGDSVGHWAGATLVVDTTNFNDGGGFYGDAGGNFGWDRNLHLVEQFSLLDVDTLLYRFEIDDPTAFTQPWKGELTMARSSGPIYEYACHEGNYALPSMLRGYRASERQGANPVVRRAVVAMNRLMQASGIDHSVSLHAPGAETERVLVHIDMDVGEARRFEGLWQAVRIDDDHRVEHVHQAEQRTGDAVRSGKDSSGAQDAGHFSQQTILQRRGGAVATSPITALLSTPPFPQVTADGGLNLRAGAEQGTDANRY
jgi:hypothetical protein